MFASTAVAVILAIAKTVCFDMDVQTARDSIYSWYMLSGFFFFFLFFFFSDYIILVLLHKSRLINGHNGDLIV